MIGKQLISEKPITLSEVKEIIQDRKKDGELTYEQNAAYEYVKEFGKGGKAKCDAAVKSIMELGVGIALAVNIVNARPTVLEQIMLILEKSRTTIDEAAAKKIIDIVAGLE
ncbi:MAG: hypothetical protein V1911_03660 [Candidatus Micrarchaeota archaeon]